MARHAARQASMGIAQAAAEGRLRRDGYPGGEKKSPLYENFRLKRCIFLKQAPRSANDATSILESALHGAQPRQVRLRAL